MFVELGAFYSEKESYNQRVENLKSQITDPNLLERSLEEERLKFKGITRKYLAPALGVIKEMFGVDYSLYKAGRDVDANFKTIETTVHKTQTEIANEMNEFVQKANGMQLDEYKTNRLNIAIAVIMSYVDDAAVSEDENKAFFLNHSKVVASSFDLPVTKKEDVEPQTAEPQNNPPAQSIQTPTAPVYNPYANQPINLNNLETASTNTVNGRSHETLVDPFASIYGGTNVPNPPSNEQQSLDSLASHDLTYQPPQDNLYQIPQNNSPVPNTNVFPEVQNQSVNVQPIENNYQQPTNNIFGQTPTVNNQTVNNSNLNNNSVFVPVVPIVQPQPVPSAPVEPMVQNQTSGMDMSQLLYSSPAPTNQPPANNSVNTQFVVPVVPNMNTQIPQNNSAVMNQFPNQPMTFTQPTDVQPPQQVMNSGVNQATSAVVGVEKNAIAMQLLSAVLIPILVVIGAAIIYFVFTLDFVGDFTADMPNALISFAVCLIMATVCLILSGPIVSLARKCTGYIERFLVAPALLSIPVAYFMLQFATKIEISDFEMALHYSLIIVFASMLYFIFVTLMFVRGFVNSTNNPNVSAPRWSIFDKLGMLCVLYMIIIPAISITCTIIGVNIELIDKMMGIIYFADNADISQHLGKIFLIGAPVVAGLGMIMRSVLIFKGNKRQ